MSIRTGGQALAFVWRAAPGPITAYLLLSVLGALAPVAIVWLTKLVIDLLASGVTGWSKSLTPAAALAAVGVASFLPHAARYLRAETERRVYLNATATSGNVCPVRYRHLGAMSPVDMSARSGARPARPTRPRAVVPSRGSGQRARINHVKP
ncbi:hypothetical protein ACBJ59_54300 [Nonomuraea sp. MTCD27]|uniref:hypothetical protein n=1 Tax=Nonomuraea sp. MTCD27 TaxID=1676747 RepID=UPI0035C19D63